jgi:hypothetical protein
MDAPPSPAFPFWLFSRPLAGSGRALLEPVFERFDEGLDTADLKSAKRLLAALA